MVFTDARSSLPFFQIASLLVASRTSSPRLRWKRGLSSPRRRGKRTSEHWSSVICHHLTQHFLNNYRFVVIDELGTNVKSADDIGRYTVDAKGTDIFDWEGLKVPRRPKVRMGTNRSRIRS